MAMRRSDRPIAQRDRTIATIRRSRVTYALVLWCELATLLMDVVSDVKLAVRQWTLVYDIGVTITLTNPRNSNATYAIYVC